MIRLTTERGTQAWREAHRGKISASDIPAAMASQHSKIHQSLIERLVLDQTVPDHRDEFPDPWQEAHEAALKVALAALGKRHRRVLESPGLFQADPPLSCLVCSPHCFTKQGGLIHFRLRHSLRSWHRNRFMVRPNELAKLQALMWVTDRRYAVLVDYWCGDGLVPDRFEQKRVNRDDNAFWSVCAPALWRVMKAVRDSIGAA